MSLREEFVRLASVEGVNMSQLCREFGIGRRTGYRWLGRVQLEGVAGLADRSRRPHTSPRQTAAELEGLVLALRAQHPAWGGRKLARRLRDQGHADVPAPSTVTAILRRHGLLDGPRAGEPRAFTRFEHAAPNDLWQMDFKGHVACGTGRCHPLTVLDDHSRYNVVLRACADERTATVRETLTAAFRAHGLPERIAVDNGAPWGDREGAPYTPLSVWLLRLGVAVSHSRPYHPQTLGKDERFHQTLKREVLHTPLVDLADGQRRFDAWRRVYNQERPHEALADAVPATRYRPSERPYPERLPPLEYLSTDIVRRVQAKGFTHLHGRVVRLPKAFRGQPVAFRPLDVDGHYAVVFATVPIAELDLTTIEGGVSHVSEHLAHISPV
jgi:transposase InsO family protein